MLTAVELTAYLRSAVTVLLAVAAAFIAARRLAAALETPLGPCPLLIAGGLLAGLAHLAHAPRQTGRLPAGSVLISLAMLVIAASLSFARGRLAALLGFWAVIIAEELWAWRGMLPTRRWKLLLLRPWKQEVPRETWKVSTDSPMVPVATAEPADGDACGRQEEPLEPAADVLQQLTLRTTAVGGQELSGWLRMPLAAGQRTGSLHVAFCPSFAQAPQVEVEPVCGPDCRIKAAQVLPYGARLDVKLDGPAADDENVLVWFFAYSEE